METSCDAPPASEVDTALAAALDRIKRLTEPAEPAAAGIRADVLDARRVHAVEPASFRAADLTDSEVEALILKFLLARGDATGRDIADQVKLPFVLVDELLREMKNEQLVVHRGSAPMNDFQYQLSDLGRERGRRYSQHCTYFGAAPVSLAGLHRQRPRPVAHQAASHGREPAPRVRRTCC